MIPWLGLDLHLPFKLARAFPLKLSQPHVHLVCIGRVFEAARARREWDVLEGLRRVTYAVKHLWDTAANATNLTKYAACVCVCVCVCV